jgi:hypothetical protein
MEEKTGVTAPRARCGSANTERVIRKMSQAPDRPKGKLKK